MVLDGNPLNLNSTKTTTEACMYHPIEVEQVGGGQAAYGPLAKDGQQSSSFRLMGVVYGRV